MRPVLARLPAPHVLLGAACCRRLCSERRPHPRPSARQPDRRLVPAGGAAAPGPPASPGRARGGSRRLVVGRRSARRDRPEPPDPSSWARRSAHRSWSRRRRAARASSIRVQGDLHRFGALRVTEPILLELPAGRAPAQGDVLDALGVLAAPHGPENGFDERTWLRHRGIHVVLRVDRWRVTGRRGGIGGVADRLRGFVTRGLSQGSRRRAARPVARRGARSRRGALAKPARPLSRLGPLPPARRFGGRTSRSWPAACSWPPGWPASRGWSASSGRSRRSPLTCSPSARSRRSSAPASRARSARSRGYWRAIATAGGSCSSARSSCSAWNPYTLFDAGFQLSFAAVVGDLHARPAAEPCARGLSRAGEGGRLPRRLDRLRAGDGADSLAPVPRGAAARGAGQRARGPCGRTAPRARARRPLPSTRWRRPQPPRSHGLRAGAPPISRSGRASSVACRSRRSAPAGPRPRSGSSLP